MKVRLLKSSIRILDNSNKAFYEKIKEKYEMYEMKYFDGASLVFLSNNHKFEQNEEQRRLNTFLQNLFYYWQYNFEKNQTNIHSYVIHTGLQLQLQDAFAHLTTQEKQIGKTAADRCLLHTWAGRCWKTIFCPSCVSHEEYALYDGGCRRIEK